MTEIESVGYFAANVEKLGIIGIMAIGLVYFGYVQNTALKQMTKALEELRDISRELARNNEIFLGQVREQFRDVEEEIRDMRRILDVLTNIMKVRKSDLPSTRSPNMRERADDRDFI